MRAGLPRVAGTWLVLASMVAAAPATADCGDRGGPGYRGPSGKCVGWAEFGRVCGTPPEKRCVAENVQTGGRGSKTADEGAHK